jgi:hypothetical protein
LRREHLFGSVREGQARERRFGGLEPGEGDQGVADP